MPKPKLAMVLFLSIGMGAAIDMAFAFSLALEHKAFVIPLASMTGFIPALVIARLAWQGRLAPSCRTAR